MSHLEYPVIPVFIGNIVREGFVLDDEDEFRLVKKIVLGRDDVRALAPVYYPLIVVSVNDHASIVMDPLSSNVYKFSYRIPDLGFLKNIIETYSVDSARYIDLLRKVKDHLQYIIDGKNIITRGIFFEKMITDRDAVKTINNLVKHAKISKIDGLLIASTNISEYESLVSNNINAVKLFYRDVSSVYNDLNHIWSRIKELRRVWERQIIYERDVELYRISRSYELITDIVKDEVKRLNNEAERETKKVSEKYRHKYNQLMQRILRLDQRIEFLRNKIARTSGDEKAKYREMLREYLNERSLLIKEIKKIDRESRKSLNRIREKYVDLINTEYMRQRFIEKEKGKLVKDYERIMMRVDNTLFTIESLITRIIEMVNDYINMFQNMLIETPRFGDGIYLLKGYVVLSMKGYKLFTTSRLKTCNLSKPSIGEYSVVKNLFMKHDLRDRLLFDSKTIYQYNRLKPPS